jgi:hypothetical protein
LAIFRLGLGPNVMLPLLAASLDRDGPYFCLGIKAVGKALRYYMEHGVTFTVKGIGRLTPTS